MREGPSLCAMAKGVEGSVYLSASSSLKAFGLME